MNVKRRTMGEPAPPRRTPILEGSARRRVGRACGVPLLLVVASLLAGCLEKPGIEDRWTRIDLKGSSLTPYQILSLGSTQAITVSADVTYRSILTGVAVAELRASSTISAADLELSPDAPRLKMAQDIDRLLANSVSVGRATRAVTGWDHLIQHIDFSFAGAVPSVVDSAGTGAGGLFLVCYLGKGQRIELANGQDSIIVTPFLSSTYKILPLGMELAAAPPGP